MLSEIFNLFKKNVEKLIILVIVIIGVIIIFKHYKSNNSWVKYKKEGFSSVSEPVDDVKEKKYILSRISLVHYEDIFNLKPFGNRREFIDKGVIRDSFLKLAKIEKEKGEYWAKIEVDDKSYKVKKGDKIESKKKDWEVIYIAIKDEEGLVKLKDEDGVVTTLIIPMPYIPDMELQGIITSGGKNYAQIKDLRTGKSDPYIEGAIIRGWKVISIDYNKEDREGIVKLKIGNKEVFLKTLLLPFKSINTK
jgi:hypothetical protein